MTFHRGGSWESSVASLLPLSFPVSSKHFKAPTNKLGHLEMYAVMTTFFLFFFKPIKLKCALFSHRQQCDNISRQAIFDLCDALLPKTDEHNPNTHEFLNAPVLPIDCNTCRIKNYEIKVGEGHFDPGSSANFWTN